MRCDPALTTMPCGCVCGWCRVSKLRTRAGPISVSRSAVQLDELDREGPLALLDRVAHGRCELVDAALDAVRPGDHQRLAPRVLVERREQQARECRRSDRRGSARSAMASISPRSMPRAASPVVVVLPQSSSSPPFGARTQQRGLAPPARPEGVARADEDHLAHPASLGSLRTPRCGSTGGRQAWKLPPANTPS